MKTASNAEMYLDCVTQKAFRDCLVGVRLGIKILKVLKNLYVRDDVLPDNNCKFCPGFEDNERHLLFVCKTYVRIKTG